MNMNMSKLGSLSAVLVAGLGLAVFSNPLRARAGSFYVSELTPASVQAACDSARDGDTIVLPAGTVTWTTNVTIVRKSLTVRGQGMDQTIIRDEIGGGSWSYVFRWQTMDNKPFVMRDFSIVQHDTLRTSRAIMLENSQGFRIHNVGFSNLTSRGIYTGSQSGRHSFGLVDACVFHAPHKATAQGITVTGSDYMHVTNFNASGTWAGAPNWGTTNAFYIENCLFDFSYRNDAAIELYNGAAAVVRYNHFRNSNLGVHGCDSGTRSGHWWEFYHNTMTSDQGGGVTVGQYRGGTGVWWSNTFNVTGTPGGGPANANQIQLSLYRATHDLIMNYGPRGFLNGSMRHDGNTPDGETAIGTHDGANGAIALTDRTRAWLPNQWVHGGVPATTNSPHFLWNRTKGAGGWITNNTSTTAQTMGLTNVHTGASVTWNVGDVYVITTGYPGLDQPGRSGPTVFHATHSVQSLAPLYQWGNTFNGETVGVFRFVPTYTDGRFAVVWPSPDVFLQEGRDYYNDTVKPGYTPLEYPHPLQTAHDSPHPPGSLRISD